MNQIRLRLLRECQRGRREAGLVDKLAHSGFALRDVERAVDDLLHERLLEIRDSFDCGSTQGRPRSCIVQSLFTTNAGRLVLINAGRT